jgi:hypothetical protein
MGRLTLNVLLSFAQFEREVTGERIRDKIAASKKKGLWMSGKPPIGYELKDKKLLIDNNNVQKVKTIFDKYLELKSVQNLIVYLRENNIKTRYGYAFTKGPLYHMLQNKTYIGLITDKENVYQGEHEAIIDNETFENVQKLLLRNRVIKKCSVNSKNPSLLAGKIFDDKGNYMSPSHSNTKNKKYRYYVSQAVLQFRKQDAGSLSKIPAGEIEALVENEIKLFLFNTENIKLYIENSDAPKQKDLFSTLEKLNTDIKDRIDRIFIRTILSKIVLYKEKVSIILCKDQLVNVLEAMTFDAPYPEELRNDTQDPIIITKDMRLSRTSQTGSALVIQDSSQQEPYINQSLVNAIVKSYHWNNLLLTGEVKTSIDIQKMENLKDNTYIKNILRLRYLAPTIVENILNGTQARDLTVKKLLNIKTLDWEEQKKLLNI